MAYVTEIYRHPIKAHGTEALDHVTLSPGKTMPWDRTWAVAHEAAKADGSDWASCANFSRGAKAPQLMAITSKLDVATATLTLSHPDRKDFTFQPDDNRQLTGFLAWVKPLMPQSRAQSTRIVRAPGRGMTDTDYPSISINNHASLRDLSDKMGTPLSPLRFRGNIWVEGLDSWAEQGWAGRQFTIGGVTFEGLEPIGRCMATTANPVTGEQDVQTLDALKTHYGHQDFGLYAKVISGGTVRTDDKVNLL